MPRRLLETSMVDSELKGFRGMDSKKKLGSVIQKGVTGERKRKAEAVKDDRVKELPIQDKFRRKVGQRDKSEGGDESAAKTSRAGGGAETTEKDTTEKIKVVEECENKSLKTLMKRKRGADGEIVQAFLLSPEKGPSRLRLRKQVPSFRMVELSDEDGEKIIGKRVKVYWSGSKKWFPGRIKAFNNRNMAHMIYYDDGDKEELNLRKERFQLEVMPGEDFSLKPEPKSERKLKGSDDGMLIVELSYHNTGGEGKGKLNKNSEKVEKAAPNNALERGGSKRKGKYSEDKKAEDVLIEVEVGMISGDVDEVESYGVQAVRIVRDSGSNKDCYEFKSLTGKATDANKPSEVHSRLESNSDTKGLGSDGGEEPRKTVKIRSVKKDAARPGAGKLKGSETKIRDESPVKESSTGLDEMSKSRLRPRKKVPAFRMVELGDDDGEKIIGKRIKVYWSGSKKWFPGRIKAFDNKKMVHMIYYDDGDKEELNLRKELFQLEVTPDEDFTLKPEHKSERKLKGSDEGIVIAEFLKHDAGEEGKGKPKKNSAEVEKAAPNNALERGGSNHKGKYSEDKKAEDVVIEVEVGMISGDIDEAGSDGVQAAQIVHDGGSNKDHHEFKFLTGKATGANEPSEVHSRLESNSDTKGLGSNGGEEHRKTVKSRSVEKDSTRPGAGKLKGSETKIRNESPVKESSTGNGEMSKSRLRPRKKVPAFRMVELGYEDGEKIIGKRIKVYWSGSKKWFPGRIKSFDNKKMVHMIHYDDGDKEELNLSKEQFQLEVMPDEDFALKPEPKSERKLKGEGMVIAEFVTHNAGEEGKGRLKKNSAKLENAAPNNAFERVGSKRKGKYSEDKTAEDVYIEVEVGMISGDIDEVESDRVQAARIVHDGGSNKDHHELKSLTDKATDANKPSEVHSRMEPNFDTKGLYSDGGEEHSKTVIHMSVEKDAAQPVIKTVKVNKMESPVAEKSKCSEVKIREERKEEEKLDTSMEFDGQRDDVKPDSESNLEESLDPSLMRKDQAESPAKESSLGNGLVSKEAEASQLNLNNEENELGLGNGKLSRVNSDGRCTSLQGVTDNVEHLAADDEVSIHPIKVEDKAVGGETNVEGTMDVNPLKNNDGTESFSQALSAGISEVSHSMQPTEPKNLGEDPEILQGELEIVDRESTKDKPKEAFGENVSQVLMQTSIQGPKQPADSHTEDGTTVAMASQQIVVRRARTRVQRL